MPSPSLALPFADAYFEYSQHRTEAVVPKYVNVFSPDNADDFNCLAILQPAPELGAKQWTSSGKRTLIGVYRDEGRTTQQQDVRLITWSRVGVFLTVTSPKPHYLAVRDEVELFNINTPTLRCRVDEILSATQFLVRTSVLGPTGGASGGYRPIAPINFYEDYIVYRLLPSFKILKVASVIQLLASAAPQATAFPISLFDPALGALVKVSGSLSLETRGNNGLEGVASVNHRQQFNENKRPLEQRYAANGSPITQAPRHTKRLNVTQRVQLAPAGQLTPKLVALDYYGFELNDAARGPFFANDLLTYDSTVPTGLKRKTDLAGRPLYTGPVFDEFGNLVVGAASPSSLIVRDLVMPIPVDQFNVPLKSASRRT